MHSFIISTQLGCSAVEALAGVVADFLAACFADVYFLVAEAGMMCELTMDYQGKEGE